MSIASASGEHHINKITEKKPGKMPKKTVNLSPLFNSSKVGLAGNPTASVKDSKCTDVAQIMHGILMQ